MRRIRRINSPIAATNSFTQNIKHYQVKNDFILKLNRTLSNIQQFPESFPESLRKKGLRKCVITKQTTIFTNTTVIRLIS